LAKRHLLPDAEDVIAPEQTRRDEDDRLKPEFVRVTMVEAGDAEGARARRAAHPADIADLLVGRPRRPPRARRGLADLPTATCSPRENDWCGRIARTRSSRIRSPNRRRNETDDAVAIIEDMEEEEQRCCAR
jgi:magnesium transporter